jgi:hypothetical protein
MLLGHCGASLCEGGIKVRSPTLLVMLFHRSAFIRALDDNTDMMRIELTDRCVSY